MRSLQAIVLIVIVILGSTLSVSAQEQSVNSDDLMFFLTFDEGMYTVRSLDYNTGNSSDWIATTRRWFTPSTDKSMILTSILREGTIAEGDYNLVLITDGDIIEIATTGDNFGGIWSPTNTEEIAYITIDKETSDSSIVVVNLSGIDQPNILHSTTASISHLAWSTSGEYLAFVSCETVFECHINVLEYSSQELQEITLGDSLIPINIVWQPYTDSLTVIAAETDSFTNQHILQVDTVNDEISIISSVEQSEYASIAWDNLGTRLAYSSNMEGDWDVFAYDPINETNVLLTDNQNLQDGLNGIDWSANGSTIVYSSGPIDGLHQLFTLELDGEQDAIILTTIDYHVVDPVWTP